MYCVQGENLLRNCVSILTSVFRPKRLRFLIKRNCDTSLSPCYTRIPFHLVTSILRPIIRYTSSTAYKLLPMIVESDLSDGHTSDQSSRICVTSTSFSTLALSRIKTREMSTSIGSWQPVLHGISCFLIIKTFNCDYFGCGVYK